MRSTLLLLSLLLVQACGQDSHVQTISSVTVPQTEEAKFQREKMAQEQRELPIPIFIITCDRLTVLKKTIASFSQSTSRPYEVVIHDNHSTFPKTVAYLDELERQGVKVYRYKNVIKNEFMLDNVANTIKDWYKNNYAPYYAVTDPDIEFEQGPGTVLDIYADLLHKNPDINVVGPTLLYNDLPDHFPFKEYEVTSRSEYYAKLTVFDDMYEGQPYSYVRAPIDTTFGLYRAGFTFHRLNEGLQTFSPFAARHLDFYLDPNNLTDDQKYYMHHASSASHVGGPWMREYIETRDKD